MFKDIPGYEGLYEINEFGIVRSLKTGKEKTIIKLPNEKYPYTQLWKNNKYKNYRIHRLVALTFIPNPNNLPIVMHLDNNPFNNHVSNLKWGTISENTKQAYDDGLITMPKQMPYRYYEIYNENRSISTVCKGYEAVKNNIGYGTIATVHNAVSQNGQLRYGPYKGCRVQKLIKGVTYDN